MRFLKSCSLGSANSRRRITFRHIFCRAPVLLIVVSSSVLVPAEAQRLLRAVDSGQSVNMLPSDMQVLEADDNRKDLPCTVNQRKPELGFDLRFHSGYDVTVPMRELSGDSNLLTIVFRVYSQSDKAHPTFFAQHFTVPAIEEDARGDAVLQGGLDLGEGSYHVDWLMRDRSERFCSSSWDLDADLGPKD
jgi:hypothetical protein